MNDRVARITGHVEDAETRSLGDGFVCELATVQAARHHHVSEQKIDAVALVERP